MSARFQLFTTLAVLASLALTTVLHAKSVSYVTQSGYSSVSGQSGDYQNAHPGQMVNRYLYAAFQKGVQEGNLRAQLNGASFYFEPSMGYYHVIMDRPGYSSIDIHFRQDPRYRVQSANLSILEKLYGVQAGYLRIDVNGRNLVSGHSARSYQRFTENTWSIAGYIRSGSNHIRIQLQRNGNAYCLLGAKVETREIYSGGGGGTDHYENERFVRRMFERFHNRQPSLTELNYYTRLLNSGARTRIEVREMIRSLDTGGGYDDEYTDLVEEYFMRYGNRPPTDWERSYYSNRLRSNTMTLPQLIQEIQRITSSEPGDTIEQKVRDTFYREINRYPTAQELRYYTAKIRSAQMNWQQLEEEIRALNGTGTGFGPGLTPAEVERFGFTREELDWQFWNRFEQTSVALIQQLNRRCNFVILNGGDAVKKQVATQIQSRIKTKFPGMY